VRQASVVCGSFVALVLLTLDPFGGYNRANAQTQLDSSGIPQATSTFPVEHGVVNLNNGALHLEIPIVNYSQRGNVQLPATLNYDSNIWKLNTDASTGTSEWLPNGAAPSGQSATGGWYVSYHPTNQSITPVQWTTMPCTGGEYATEIDPAVSWMDQSGTTHVFPATIVTSTCTGVDGNSYTANTTATAYATDGSGYYAVVQDYATQFLPAVNIYDRAGSLVASNNLNVPIVQPGAPVSQPVGGLSSFGGVGLSNGPVLPVDRNGNSPVYSGSTILDTMNRNLINDTGIVTVAGVGTVEYINVPVAGGHTATYTINYKTITVSAYNYVDLPMLVVSSVVLPDGSSYQFGYNDSYGELASMTLPHGGQVSYTYETTPGVSGAPDTRWVQQHVGSDGTTNFAWSQAATSSYSQAGTACGAVTNQVTTASANNVYKFSSCNGNILLQEVDHGSATSSKVDAIDLYSYDATNPCPTLGTATVYHIGCTGLQWLNITGKTTVLPSTGGSGGGIVTDTQYSYANPGTGVPTSVKQWDYYAGAPTSLPDSPPGLPTREVDTTLGYSVNNGALFPTLVSIKDSTGTIASSTTYTYDEPAYMSSTPSTAPNHSDSLAAANRGNLTTVTRCCGWNGSSNSVSVTSHTWYNDAGTVITTQDPNGNKTSFTAFDPTDTLPTTITLPSTVSPSGVTVSHVVEQTYDPNSGQLASVTDENGQTTTQTFDQYGRPYQVQFSNAGNPITLETTTYPSANETDVSVLQSPGVLLSASSIVDSFGRPSQFTQNGVSTETTYDGQGRLYTITNAHLSTPSSTNGTTSFGHDELGRLNSVTLPNGFSTTYSYAQNVVTVTDPVQHSREIVSDAFGNATWVYEPDNTGALSLATNYQYNWGNQLSQVLQEGGTTDSTQWRKRTFFHDGLGRLIYQTTPEAGTVQFGYDNNGNLTSTQNQNTTNNTTQYLYDALNRIYSATIGGGPTYTYTYDAQDSSGDSYGKERLTSVSNGTNVQTMWQHDPLGRTISSAYCLPSDCTFGYKVLASFDYQGNQTSLTYPDGRQVQWSYDQLNRPISETYAQFGSNVVNSPYISNVSYTPTGQLQQATLGNGVQFGATYDTDENLSSLVYVANGAPIVEKTYVWANNASNLTSITDLAAGRTQSYQYDQLDRIASVLDTGTTANACNVNLPGTPSASQTYTIDPWGNMTSTGTGANLSYTAGSNNQLPPPFQYDSAGNLTNDAIGGSYQYRADGLMTESGGTTYTYDALGQRVRKDGSSPNEYIYYGGQVLAMRNPTTGAWTDRIYSPLGALATVPGTQTGAPVYRASDHLGSLNYTLDSSGNVMGMNSVLPYGELSSNTTSDSFPFTDHERDSENGTDATLYRHYASWQGRWLSPDPSNGSYNLLDPQSLNRYAYLNNRVMAQADPEGLDGCDVTGGSINCVYTGGGGSSGGGGSGDDGDDGDDGDGTGYYYGSGSNGDGCGVWCDVQNFFTSLFDWNEGESHSTPAPPPTVPSVPSNLAGTTQPNSGTPWIDANMYYRNSNGVATGSWSIVDSSPGLDADGTVSIPMTWQGGPGTGVAGNDGTPWYNSCGAKALGGFLLHGGIDALGVIPGESAVEAGFVTAKAGYEALQFGSGVASTAWSLSDTSPIGKVGTGLGVSGVALGIASKPSSLRALASVTGTGVKALSGFIPVVGQAVAIGSVLWDGITALQEYSECSAGH
jgi:RHS repeat-associated protein